MILSLILQLAGFCLIIPLCFTLPGLLITNRAFQSHGLTKLTVATVIGFLQFSILAYLFFMIQIGWLLIPIILLVDLYLIFKHQPKFSRPSVSQQQLLIFSFIMLIGIILQLLVITPSGWMSDGTIQFWSAHGHDANWHVALMNELPKGWPWQNPAFAGERLVNYHFFSDVAPAWLTHYLHFDPFDLYLRLTPIFHSLLFGVLLFLVGRQIGRTFTSGIWSMIFGFGCGSFGYIVTLVKRGDLNGETLFGANQIQSSIGNPPQILSLIILLTFIIVLGHYLTKSNKWLLLCGILLLGCSVVFKVYGGVVMFFGLGIICLWQLLLKRRFSLLPLFGGGGLLAALLYLPNTANSQSFLIWQPWWFIRTMIIGGDRLDWLDHELRRQTYIAENNWKRVIQLEIEAFFIFVIGNSSLRLLGFWQLITEFKRFLTDPLWLFLLSTMLVSFILPLIFLQRGVAGNTIQFLQYYLLILGIFAAVTVAQLIDRLKTTPAKIIISIILIVIMIPTQIGLLIAFYSRPPFSQIDQTEQSALAYLRDQTPTDAIILTPPFNKYFKLDQPTPPIWAWFDTAYLSALSNRRSYLADTEQVDIMGYDLKNRQLLLEQLFTTTNPGIFNQLLNDSKADYLYFSKLQAPEVDLTTLNLTKVFENQGFELWQIN